MSAEYRHYLLRQWWFPRSADAPHREAPPRMPCIRLRVAVYDDDPIAVEPQLDEDELDGDSDESNVQEEIISAEPHKGSAD